MSMTNAIPPSTPETPSALAPLAVRETLAGKHLLVTGITGFLGKVWLSMLVSQVPEIRKLTLLVRPKKGVSPEERMRRIFECSPAMRPVRAALGETLHEYLRDRVRVVEATLGATLCGFDEASARELVADVDASICFAGLTDFQPDPLAALEANVIGATNVADLTALSRGRRYLHVSTSYVCGSPSRTVEESITRGLSPLGDRFDPEEEVRQLQEELAAADLPGDRTRAAKRRAARLGWPNIYTYSKGLAEHLLAGREDVRVTTVRPAIVECAREFPFVGWNEGINTSGPLVWLLGSSFRRFPSRSSNHFDVVPVDTVARGTMLATALALRDEAEEIFHVASSDQNPFLLGRAIELTALAWRRIYRKEKKGVGTLLRHLESYPVEADDPLLFDLGTLRRAARGIRTLLKGDPGKSVLPGFVHELVGEPLQKKTRSISMDFRNTDRQLGRIEEMLRLYRPFIYEHDWTFRTGHLAAATSRLDAEERALFGFDIETLDWRDYWL
ncbi:MAG: SDR family oxidoreductase, partial [Myxococcales bacterium]|nr:SDR family oxidoreductase [Myxococcales bacterium]